MAHTGFQGDGIVSDLVLGPKARPIPVLGNAQGTRKPIRSKQLPSPHRSAPGPKGPGAERWGDGNCLILIGLRVPWALPKAGMGQAFGPKTRSHSIPSPWNPV